MTTKKILNQSIEALLNSQVILYPTDTVWGLGCDATNIDAVAKIFKLKNRIETKSLVVLVSSIEMLRTYVDAVPQKAIDIISTTKKPTTIIYNNPKGLAANAIALDNTIAIRIPTHNYCLEVINKLGKPIISTSANISGESTPKSFSEISLPILEGVDYVVNLEQDKITDKSSTILKLVGNTIEVIRA
ncbi:L-threonylcarbamoyladenylate synthase [Flavobacteriaceae bacterium]|nr:L-threonylcarbamoyladenylate synthase [Flavobacteriaceae bacterium]MDB4496905.1 L-threonylcarbamoyladenylate synthase [Flavobacteriaceae bacterium]MDC1167584.1 L-threonylcarbamoyladenylate synthase [Flavobacteriaceae bacterium]MDC3285514.1 L-threonylcarbamoyladenylate synthase [Flavobacteriaceae bacterium]MDC3318895.1 L-threonylcarbamoyladenylate synthase [Flavobacteriaceae bacterium]